MKVLLYWTALVFPGAILWGSALQAQDAAGDRVNMVIAYSEDECPQPINSDEIVVCQILVEAERFRIHLIYVRAKVLRTHPGTRGFNNLNLLVLLDLCLVALRVMEVLLAAISK